MHSTSNVTCSESTSAAVRGNVIIGSGQTGASRPTNRYTRFIHRDRRAGHGLDPALTGAPTPRTRQARLVGMGRSPARRYDGLPGLVHHLYGAHVKARADL